MDDLNIKARQQHPGSKAPYRIGPGDRIKTSRVVPGMQRFTPTPLRTDPRCFSGCVANYEQGARA